MNFRALFAASVLATVLAFSCAHGAEILQMETEEVIGIQNRPHLGIVRPEFHDPLHDPVWLAGFRESFTSEIPEELKNVDALTRAKALGRLVGCADAWYYPFTVSVRKKDPPGIDMEILRAIAARRSWRVEMVWANTATRGGLGPAFARTIDKGYCDFFLGLVITGEDDDMLRHKLTFTHPYLGQGYVLALQGKAKAMGIATLADVKKAGLKVGVPAYSPAQDFLVANGIEYESYFWNQRLIDGMARGELDAGLLWSGAMGVVQRDHPNLHLTLPPGYVPPTGQRWNGAWAVPLKEKQLKEFFDAEIDSMLKSGEIQAIVESYGVPFYPPF